MARWNQTLEERFWAKVSKTNGCWIWTGARNHGGYGQIRIDGKTHQATKTAWQLAGNFKPSSFWLLHKCDNPPCVQPDHLYLGTHADNVRDRTERGRMPIISGEHVGNHKLSLEQVKAIRRIGKTQSYCQTAREFGVNNTTIRRIIVGRNWCHD